MNRILKRIVAGLVLTVLPVFGVLAVKKSAWGPILATPKVRQQGPSSAPVVIVEYSDFQCPMCANIQPTVHSFMDYYKGKVRLVYKYFPLTKIHKNALTSAHAAECAAAQNQFWPYEDRLFATQKLWADLTDPTTHFIQIVTETHLDPVKFKACYNDPSRLAPIEADQEEGRRREVSATPTFFVNGTRLVGQGFADEGAVTIEKELKK